MDRGGFERVAVKDGDEFRLGELLVRVLETPGHTPEHLSYLLLDAQGAKIALLSGGALMVGTDRTTVVPLVAEPIVGRTPIGVVEAAS